MNTPKSSGLPRNLRNARDAEMYGGTENHRDAMICRNATICRDTWIRLAASIRRMFFLLPLLLLGIGAFAQDDAVGQFFGKYVDDPRFTVVSVSPRMFRLLSKVNWDTVPADLKQTVARLRSLRVLSTKTTPEHFFKEALQLIDHKQYEELITVRGNKDNVRFLVKGEGDKISELLMIAADADDFTLMSFVGDIDLDKLSRLSADLDIKGMENLKNAKRK